MQKNPLISIIIPIYNVEEFLPKCIESIINQTYENLEIICVNDESPDNSLDILEKYREQDSRIVIINKKNEGLSQARNDGIEKSTGDYIMFVDGDDWIDENMCKEMLKAIGESSADVCMCCYLKEFADHSSVVNVFEEDKFFEGDNFKNGFYKHLVGLTGENLSRPEKLDSAVTVWNRLTKREVIGNVRFIDLRLIGTEDLMFNLQISSNTNKLVYINKPFYHYRKTNAGSLTSKHKPMLYSQREYMFDLIDEIIKKNKLPKDFEIALNNRIALNMIGLGLNEIYSDKSSFSKAKALKEILKTPRYEKAFKNLEFKYFPLHWKVFFMLCKVRWGIPLVMLLKVMEFLRRRIK